MKTFQKKICILISLMMVIGICSGCKKEAESQPDVQSGIPSDQTDGSKTSVIDTYVTKLQPVDFSEHVGYTYWTPATVNEIESDYSKNSVVQYINKKFNMTLKFQQPVSGTETDSLNLMLGTGEYTDIIDSSYYQGSIDQLYIDGVIIDIAKYLDYMPNFKALLEKDEVFRKNVYNDSGMIFKLPEYITEDPLHWGGLVYRRDILETMTGGNIAFPSGNDEPITIEDWDYMLPLFQQYFEYAGFPDFATLIIPACGYFITSDLITTFGASASYYIDDGIVKYGPIEDGFYKYLKKMHEWYQKGYVYKDFATRTNDLFFLPNTSLTYGGSAGIWFGMTGQLGTAMSLPEYGLNVEVEPLANPIDAEGSISAAPNMMYRGHSDQMGGAMISKSCKNVERLLTVIDYMYSDEGSLLKEYGITKEQGAADYELYKKYGLEDGAYSIDSNGDVVVNEKLGADSTLSKDVFVDYKLPGMRNNTYTNRDLSEINKTATKVWLKYGYSGLPPIYRTSEEEDIYISKQSSIDDYVNTMVLKFILGEQELNETNWENYKNQLNTFGIQANITIQQAAYDRYKVR